MSAIRSTEVTPDETAELVSCIVDLSSLMQLPALWHGRDAEAIVRTLCEALEAVLPADVCLVQHRYDFADPISTQLRVARRPVEDKALSPWRDFMQACREQTEAVTRTESPAGTVAVARIRMNFGTSDSSIWVASRHEDFPSARQKTYLLGAANLASSGLNAARLAEERHRADQAKDEFLAMLAHELRNPLAPITTALELMELKASPDVAYERELIGRQVRHLSRLVDDLMDIARVARGKVHLRRTVVNLSRVVSDAVELAQPLIKQRAHQLEIRIPTDHLFLEGDAERLKQIIANLLTNAARYTDPGGRIVLSATRKDNRFVLSVADNGIGIDPDLLPRVFDLFTQGKTSPDRPRGGLGVGLALVKTLVELHGGTVRAESPGVGAGSLFTVELPALTDRMDDIDADDEQERRSVRDGQERILIVDDNTDAADSMGLLLKMLGHEVRVASDGEAAMSFLDAYLPTVAFLDIGLPGIDGYELAQRIRSNLGDRAPRLIALTGYGQEGDRERSRQAGFDHHCTKPLQLETLSELIAGTYVTQER